MGWKLNTIVYTTNKLTEDSMVVTIGNFYEGRQYEKIDKRTFRDTLNPEDETFFIGKYKGNIIINASEMVFEFFSSPSTKTEKMWKMLTVVSSNKVHAFVLYQFCFRISHIFKFIKANTSLEILTIAKAILAFSALYLI